MIGYIDGKVHTVADSFLILLTGGVGYKVLTPLSLILSVSEGDSLSLHIHTHVREDQITLFGFKEDADLFVFNKLISVSGIGPKGALAMLSVHSTASIADAIEKGDASTLSHTPGIGKKTAEKIIIELKGKLSHLQGSVASDATLEVRLALESLGYSSKEIHSALEGLSVDNKTTSMLIREALQKLQ